MKKFFANSAGWSPSAPSGNPSTLTLLRRRRSSASSDFATNALTVSSSSVIRLAYPVVQSSVADIQLSDSVRRLQILSRSALIRLHFSVSLSMLESREDLLCSVAERMTVVSPAAAGADAEDDAESSCGSALFNSVSSACSLDTQPGQEAFYLV